jgi:UDP-glucose 4-epimerase
MIRVLITGGFGYVGGRVAQFLAEAGCYIVLGSRKVQSPPEWLPQAEVVQLQWVDDEALINACRCVEIVIHAAGMNAEDCAENPVKALEFNGAATARLVRASLRAGVSKFIYFSTAHVYRSPLVGYFDDNSCPRNAHPYASTHLAGEQAVAYVGKNNSKFDAVVLRLTNAIGRPVSTNVNCWNLLVNDLCKELVKTGKMTISGNIHDVRDFIPMKHVCNVCEYIINTRSRMENTIYNVCSGKTMTIEQVAELIGERFRFLTGRKYNLSSPYSVYDNLPKLQFAKDKFCSTDYVEMQALYENEIDGLLQFCSQYWGSST